MAPHVFSAAPDAAVAPATPSSASGRDSASLAASDSQNAAAPGLHPPQFALRTMMLTVTFCGLLFAVMSTLGAWASLTLLFFLALAAAHVLGNVIGTRLRDGATVAAGPRAAWQRRGERPPVAGARRLRERTGVSRTMVVFAAFGAALGALAGALGLALVLGEQATIAGLGLGAVSAAVLGGFFGFLMSSFLSVFSRALTEALGDPATVHQGPPAA